MELVLSRDEKGPGGHHTAEQLSEGCPIGRYNVKNGRWSTARGDRDPLGRRFIAGEPNDLSPESTFAWVRSTEYFWYPDPDSGTTETRPSAKQMQGCDAASGSRAVGEKSVRKNT